jgi:hypothetical protein
VGAQPAGDADGAVIAQAIATQVHLGGRKAGGRVTDSM